MPFDALDYDAVGEEDGAGASGARHAGGERAAAEHGGRPPREDAGVGEAVSREGPTGTHAGDVSTFDKGHRLISDLQIIGSHIQHFFNDQNCYLFSLIDDKIGSLSLFVVSLLVSCQK